MLSLDIRHPDAETFIDMKKDRTSVTGANVSVRMRDDFMKAALNDETYVQRFPINVPVEEALFTQEVKAAVLFDKLVHNAWESAEPGCLFWDRILEESPANCYPGFQELSTNPCLSGDTQILTIHGPKTFKELAESGEDVLVYAVNMETNEPVVKWMRNPRKTRENVQTLRIEFDSGLVVNATPDHKFYTLRGEKIEAKDLKEGQSVAAFSVNKHRDGHLRVSRQKRNETEVVSRYSHRMIAEALGWDIEGKVVHHIDGNPENNDPSNLRILEDNLEHNSIHYPERREKGFNGYYEKTPEIRKKISDSVKKFYEENGTDHLRKERVERVEIPCDVCGDVVKLPKGDLKHRLQGRDYLYCSKSCSNRGRKLKKNAIENHKVVSVTQGDICDVYNGTVDDVHTYIIADPNPINDKSKYTGIACANCGELPLCPYDSCRLLVVNLYTFVKNPFTSQAYFDWAEFTDTVYKAQRLMDDVVDIEIEQIDKILKKIDEDPEDDEVKERERKLWTKIRENAVNGRRTGLGVTALGDMFAALGIRYGSETSIEFADEVFNEFKNAAYASSIAMANERGAFPLWNPDLEKNNPFLNRLDKEILYTMNEIGRRNISLLTIAPTGTVSLMTRTTSGVENLFQVYYYRLRKINPNDGDTRVDFVDELGDKWTEFVVFHPKFEMWLKVNGYNVENVKKLSREELDEIVKYSPYYGATANDVDWVQKVKLQGVIQKHIDHSIN